MTVGSAVAEGAGVAVGKGDGGIHADKTSTAVINTIIILLEYFIFIRRKSCCLDHVLTLLQGAVIF